MRETDYLAVAVAFGDAGFEYRYEARRASKARMGQRGLRARIYNDHSEQDATAKDIAINEPARDALKSLQDNRYGEFLFMWPWGDQIGKVTVYDAFKKACDASRIADSAKK